MHPDDLVAALNELDDPETRIDRLEIGNAEKIRLYPSSNKAAVRRFKTLAADAATLFDPAGQGDPGTRWLRLVLDHASELVQDRGRSLGCAIDRHDEGTEQRGRWVTRTLPNAPRASALVVRRLSGMACSFEHVGTPDDLARVLDRLDLDLPERVASAYGGTPDDAPLRSWASEARTTYARLRRSDPSLPPLPDAQRGYREDLEAIGDRVIRSRGDAVDADTSIKPRRPPRSDADIARDEGNIAAYLADHPDATRDGLAKATRISAGHVSRSAAWRAHKARRKAAREANRARGIGA